jgi:uncharacterized protein YjiK
MFFAICPKWAACAFVFTLLTCSIHTLKAQTNSTDAGTTSGKSSPVYTKAGPVPTERLTIVAKRVLKIDEPSDVCLSESGTSLYIVSDNGTLYQTRLDGTIMRQSPVQGNDYEAVAARNGKIYVVEEGTRRVYAYDTATFEQVSSSMVTYMGARNKGFESLFWHPLKNNWVLITEKDPCLVFELNEQFVPLNEIPQKSFPDVSSATVFKGSIFLLSDEGQSVTRVQAGNYAPERRWLLPILNPEGLFFSPEGTLYVLSDDRRTLYTLSPSSFNK